MDEDWIETWADQVDYYRQLIDEYGWPQGPMLDFVTWLASGPYSRILCPSNSHEALGLATVPTYLERRQLPMVYIHYSDLHGFVVHWQRGQGNTVREEPVQCPRAPDVFRRILSWLGVEEQKVTEN
jgi:hypothetical protein